MFDSLIEKRRSIRRYKDRAVEQGKVTALIKAALFAPSSMGRTPWEFIVVDDKQMLEKLSTSKAHGASFLKNAPLGIVVCADPAKSDVWVEDASIAAIFMQIAAEEIGLGSCWIQIRERMHESGSKAGEYVKDLLDIPDNLEVECFVAAGYADETKPAKKKEDLLYDRVHTGAYGKK